MSFLEWSAGIRQFVFIIHVKSIFHFFFLLPPHFLFLSACNLFSDAAIFDAHDRVCNEHWATTKQRLAISRSLKRKQNPAL